MSNLIEHITDDDFQEKVIESTQPVLVDFWADWCGPCKSIAPLLETIAEEYADRIKIMKLNVDENRESPGKYGIRGIPTLIIFKEGQVAATQVGALTKSQLTAFIDQST